MPDFEVPKPNEAKYGETPEVGDMQWSQQAPDFSVKFDEYHNEIPEGTSGPKYESDHYQGTIDKTHQGGA